MSGVAAIFHFDGRPLAPETLARLASGIAGRGEHGLDLWRDGPVGLAHSHFWTTPEEVGERQPVSSRDGRLRVTADLRLDNREELCAALGDGLDARTATDAEILLAAYERWGVDCPRQLIGDFAFALWDAPQRRLFCARDVLGVRHLYYASNPRWLVAASTLEGVLGALDTPAEVNEPFLQDLVAWRLDRWIAETPYRGVLRLPPAHRMIVEDGRAAVSRYWTLGEAPPPPLRRDKEHIERFREVFLTAVRAQLRSTGPVGFSVSGGLDSSSLACAAQHLVETGSLPWSTALRLYSCVFAKTPGAEERAYAEAVARRCGNASMTFLPSDDCWGLREFAEDGGYPLAEPEVAVSRALMMRPMRAARADGCRVVVSGIGGDQVLGGEPYHTPVLLRDVEWPRLRSELPHFRRWCRQSTPSLLVDAYFRPAVPPAVRRVVRRIRGLADVPPAHAPVGLPLMSHSAEVSLRQITAPIFAARFSGLAIIAAAAGVEHRMPFLDRRLFELLLALPPRLRFQEGRIKRILRLALPGILPDEVRTRTSFALFSELEPRGLQDRERQRIESLLADSRAVRTGLVSADSLHAAWSSYWKTRTGLLASRSLIGFLCVEAWLRHRERHSSRAQEIHPDSAERLLASGKAG